MGARPQLLQPLLRVRSLGERLGQPNNTDGFSTRGPATSDLHPYEGGNGEIDGTAHDLDVYRQDLDGIEPERTAWEKPQRVVEPEAPAIERDALVIERGIGLEL